MPSGFDTFKNRIPNWGIFGLLALGVLGNFLSAPLFFGVDIIFGSIATLIIIAAFGTGWGVLSALIAGSYTMLLWNHPYGTIALIGEALFVGLLLQRFRYNLPLVSGAYWILLGIPQVYLYYRFGLGMDELGAILAAVKQGTNGIVNAIIASFVLAYTPIPKLFGIRRKTQITVFQNIFNIFVAAALVPALIIVIFDARVAFDRLEARTLSRMQTLSTGISVSTQKWLDQHVKAVQSFALLTEHLGTKDIGNLQIITEDHAAIWNDFIGAFVTDETGTAISFAPRVNRLGEPTIGLNFSDRRYFYELKNGGESPFISDVFTARGGVFIPVVNIVSSYKENGKFAGIVTASLNLEQLRNILFEMPGESGYVATLIDRSGNVITSSNSELEPLMKFESLEKGVIDEQDAGIFYRRPEPASISPMSRWHESTLGRRISFPGKSGWTLIVEEPFAPVQAELFRRYIRNLSIILALALMILLGSIWVASKISKPLTILSKETTNLPERLRNNETIAWPSSGMLEFSVLVRNFRSMVEALQQWYADLELSRTQLEKAKEEAEAANRLKSAFLANMSHEIRTPLGVMLGFSELIIDKNISDDNRAQYAQTLKRNGEQLSILINDILDLSKVEAGYLTVEIVEISLRRTLQDIVSNFSSLAGDKNLVLLSDIDPSTDDLVCTDPVRLRQVLSNLVSNAIKFTSKGAVYITVIENSNRLVIDVSDTGIGIDSVDQEKLFRPFTQADESMTRKFGGTGLGLALSKRLSRLLGGDLIIKESRPGQGSTFRVEIKNHEGVTKKQTEINQKPALPKLSTPEGRSLSGIHALLVEDSPDNQVLISRLLTKQGVELEIASNGAEGLEKALRGNHDIVIMDLQMPIMDGYEATQKLREAGYSKPILALTAHAMAEVRYRCLEVGCTDHLPKPVQPATLYQAITKYVHGEPGQSTT